MHKKCFCFGKNRNEQKLLEKKRKKTCTIAIAHHYEEEKFYYFIHMLEINERKIFPFFDAIMMATQSMDDQK